MTCATLVVSRKRDEDSPPQVIHALLLGWGQAQLFPLYRPVNACVQPAFFCVLNRQAGAMRCRQRVRRFDGHVVAGGHESGLRMTDLGE